VVEIFSIEKDGEVAVVGKLGPGEIFGELELLERAKKSRYALRSATDCKIYYTVRSLC